MRVENGTSPHTDARDWIQPPDEAQGIGRYVETLRDRLWIVVTCVVVATFSADSSGTPFIEESAVVPTDKRWLLEDATVPPAILQPPRRKDARKATGIGHESVHA